MKEKLVVYTSKGCSYCSKVKELFNNENQDYMEKNISLSEADYKEWKGRNVAGTPATFYKEEVVVGFDKSKLMELIDRVKADRA